MDPAKSPAAQPLPEPSSLPNNSPDASSLASESSQRVLLPAQTPSAPSDPSRAGLVLATFVVLLAFLLASTPARNSDVWLHLATGRAIADGTYRFQGDPFTQGSPSVWIAHSWLADLIAYGLFTSLGGSVLVILKAVLVALLAALVIWLGTREGGLAWSAVAAALAVLAFSGRLLLQPALLSAVLLAATLALLQRGRRLRASGVSRLVAWAPIWLLFALWANLDDWFLLGPLTVALYLFGELLGTVADGSDSKHADLPGLALTLGAGLLACLLTPFHIHGFTVPAELGLSASAKILKQDPVLHNLFRSPFEGRYFSSGAEWNIPGLAYLVLVLLSGVSFFGSRDSWRGWRLPVWLGLFALSAWRVRAIPFFAVAAGPILALNLQDLVRGYRPDGLRRPSESYARPGRAAAILLLLALLVAAWPGWLQGTPYERRRWDIVDAPSIQASAEQLQRWRRDGRLGADQHAFDFSPETANYLAWFCPAEKGMVDSRLRISAAEAADFVTVRRGLLEGPGAGTDWRRVLRAHRVDHLVLHDTSAERMQSVYRHLISQTTEWPLLLLTGGTAVFGWVDPARPETASVARLRLRLEQAAYHPSANQKAPAAWPGRGPIAPSWWTPFVIARPLVSPDRDRAALLVLHFDTLRDQNVRNRGLRWETTLIAAALGAGDASLPAGLQQALDLAQVQALHSFSASNAVRLPSPFEQLALALGENYFRSQDDAPPELLWLAIRAARRALHDNPDDAQAYLILGEAYLRLARNTRERSWTARTPFLTRLRTIQASAALNQALVAQPDLLRAHANLVTLYETRGMWDLTLKHLREVRRLTREQRIRPSQNQEQQAKLIAQLDKDVDRLSERVQQAVSSYEASAGNRKVFDRAQLALEQGLADKALTLLLTSDVASFGPPGTRMELDLLLDMGRIREIGEWMSPEHEALLGWDIYHRLRIQLAAARGDYQQAEAEVEILSRGYRQPVQVNGLPFSPRQALAVVLGRTILEGRLRRQSLGLAMVDSINQELVQQAVTKTASDLRADTDALVLQAMLEFEQGDMASAAENLRQALSVYRSGSEGTGGVFDFGGRPLAQHYLERLSREPGRLEP